MQNQTAEPKTKITLYGFGYVGKAVWRFLKTHYDVLVIDPHVDFDQLPDDCRPEYFGNSFGLLEIAGGLKATLDNQPIQNFKTKHAIIAVPTKMNDDGTCDTSIVEEILNRGDHEFYLTKSTVTPGTTKRMALKTGRQLVFSPEYIGEGKYEIPFWLNFPHPTEMKLHSFHIFGGPKEATEEWIQIWQKIAGWTPRYIQTDSTTAELCKYMENSFLATKKIFCDEFFEIAKAFGVSYPELRELWLADGRIGPAMTLIFPEKRGFSGKCLPKDVNAIVKAAEAAGYSADLIKQVLASNKKFRGE